MTDQRSSALSHVSLGIRRIEGFPGGAGWGRRWPECWAQTPLDGHPASVGNGTHVAFLARDRAAVQAFHAAALAAGARCAGPPARGRSIAGPITPPSCATWTATRWRRWPGRAPCRTDADAPCR